MMEKELLKGDVGRPENLQNPEEWEWGGKKANTCFMWFMWCTYLEHLSTSFCRIQLKKSEMESVYVEDERGGGLTMLEDAGSYFSPNVVPDHIINLQNFKARSDDVLLVTYPKSGAHWMSEIITMLVNGYWNLAPNTMQHLEYIPANILNELPSPRVMNSHLPYPRIPLDFFRKRSKIIVCMRNARDVAVSYYNFISNLSVWNYNGHWDSFFPLFLNGNLPYNSWFEHTESWLKVIKSGKHNIHLVFYEDFQTDFKKACKKLADFLEVPYSSEHIDAVYKETSFLNMKQNKEDLVLSLSKDGTSPIYRKGEVGDWQNWFTADQIEQIDQEMESWGLHTDRRFKYLVNNNVTNST
ncbi:Sulfotransferase 1E1 [Bulinus truncatus]|nr:Sulfotransferase 1E1 [Bulinus truncatus]